MSTAPPNATEPQKGTDAVIMQVLAAVATGVGVLGFVTFFGGAILWVRAREGGLPANDVVAVIPKPVLVTTGASFLVPALLCAVLAVGLVFLIHESFRVPWLHRRDIVRKDRRAAVARSAAHSARMLAEPSSSFAERARRIAERSRKSHEDAVAARAALQDSGEHVEGLDGRLRKLNAQAHDDELFAHEAQQRARNDELSAARAAREEEIAQAELQLGWTVSAAKRRFQRWSDFLVAFAVLCALPLWFEWIALKPWGWPAFILVMLALASFGLSVATYLVTDKFRWFGVVAFIAISVFIGEATYFRTRAQLKVEPAAVLRDDRTPAIGWFIAKTSDDLYVSTFTGERPATLLVIPRSQIKDLAVGPLLRPELAHARALEMATELCSAASLTSSTSGVAANESQDATPKSKKKSAGGCAESDRRALSAELEKAYGGYCSAARARRFVRRTPTAYRHCISAISRLASERADDPHEACKSRLPRLIEKAGASLRTCVRAGYRFLAARP